MINQTSKLSIGIAVLFELILIVTFIVNLASRQWKNLSLMLLTILCLIIPFIITRWANIKNIVLPSSFQIITLIFIFFAQYLGEFKRFYLICWWWDVLLHAIFGSYGVIIALSSFKGIIRKEQETTDQRFAFFTILFAFSITITLGTLWEVLEFAGDYLFNTSMVKGGLEDTSTDLLVKILSAFITSTILYIYRFKVIL